MRKTKTATSQTELSQLRSTRRIVRCFMRIAVSLLLIALPCVANVHAAELHIGTATADITPSLPVALDGQFNMRIAQKAATPLTANIVALESREGDRSLDMAIMVSCDLVCIRPNELLVTLRSEVHKKIPRIDEKKIFLNAIHTHTAPVLDNGSEPAFKYPIPKQGVLQPKEYNAFFIQCVTEAIVKAWNNRRPGSVSWGLSHAVIGHNRRAVYADGSAQMYGKTNVPEFRNLEGYEDHDVNVLFFWNQDSKLIAVNIEVPCTAQEVENDTSVNADYWHPVRIALRKRFNPDLCVLGWIGAAGDQSPHLMYNAAAEKRMIKLRNLNNLEEIARRIDLAVGEAYETVKEDRYTDVQLIHKVETLTLPMRLVTEKEYVSLKEENDKAAAQIAADPAAVDRVAARMSWNKGIIDRFEKQKTDPNPTMETEIHVIRIGDVVICTNQFELFTDYGIRIQARSKALQTFIIQLAGSGTYLPTERAVKGGGYSAIIQSNLVGPEGGQILVDRTVELIDSLWPGTK
ncbi:hypothetical protein LLG96_10100 [bacterium]|nr:hypothetical protein [bacterium]